MANPNPNPNPGTSQYVHRDCLDKWRAQSARSFQFCRECGFQYRLNHDASEARFTQSRYRMLVARDICAVIIAIVAYLLVVASLVAWFDPTFKLNRLFGGPAEFSRVTYVSVATIGSLAIVGLAASCYQAYSWYFFGGSVIMMDWTWCCGQCCDSYTRLSWWDWYWCTRVLEDCCALGRRSAGSIRREDMHIAAIAAFVAVVIFAVIGMFVGAYFAAALAQVIMAKHGEKLKRRVLTKEYVVEDLDGLDISTLPPVTTTIDPEDVPLVEATAPL